MDRPCSDSHIGIIAKDLTQWEMVAYTLGLSEAEVEEVDRSYELPLKRIKMLMKWKSKYKTDATYQRLITAFNFLDRCDMAERVRELSTTPSSGEVRRLSPFAEQLKMWYEHTDPDPNVWPPIDRGKFCKLALVKIEHVVNAGRGNIISDAGKKRVPIELENIFDEDVSRKELKRKKIILIEGASGSGKSTLLWYMCQKWKSGEMFQEFSLVIYIKLREYSTTQSSCSVADILPCSRKIKEEAWDEIEAVDGKGVLFLLDGWDELSQSDNSIFKDIIKSSPKHSLLLSTVVVTSRYVSSDELHCLATSRLEMLGFADQEVKECIMDITGNEEAAHALMAALESKPLLLSSMHLPLNTMIIAYVFQLKRSNLPTTLLETFKLLILNCIQRHVFKKMPDEEHEAITSLESLPKELQVSFNSLCELAFCGLLKDEMLFSKEQVKLIPDTLSLLYGHKLYEETGPRTKYSFIHQTIQELLAAMHMSKMPTVDQLKYLKKLFQPRFNAMIQFYAGVTSLQINGTAQILCDRVLSFCDFKGFEADLTSLFIRKYLRIIICNHFTGLGFSEEYSDLQLRNELTKKKYMPDEDQEAVLQSLQHGNNECTKTSVKEIEDGKKSATSFGKETLLMANCFFEAKNSELYEQLKGLELTCILANVTLSPFDCLSLGSLISQSHIRCVQLAGCNLTSSCIKSFKQGLGESSCITDFTIMEPNFTNEQCIIDMSELISISSDICRMEIAVCNLQWNGLQLILDALKDSQVHLLALYASNVQVNYQNGPILQKFIIAMPSLETLTLSANPLVGDIGAHYIGQALKCNNSLKTLNLSDCGITSYGIMPLCKGLERNKRLKDLDLSGNNISDVGIKCLSQSLALNCTLTTLRIMRCGFSEVGVVLLAKMLSCNKTITTIQLDNLKVTNMKQKLQNLGLLTFRVLKSFQCI